MKAHSICSVVAGGADPGDRRIGNSIHRGRRPRLQRPSDSAGGEFGICVRETRWASRSRASGRWPIRFGTKAA